MFRQGIEQFNRERYFEAHESWEEIWRSTSPEPRDLFQGLIQVAVGLYHYRSRERPRVARRVLAKGRRRLQPLRATSPCGLDLEALLAQVESWERWLEEGSGRPPSPPYLRQPGAAAPC